MFKEMDILLTIYNIKYLYTCNNNIKNNTNIIKQNTCRFFIVKCILKI